MCELISIGVCEESIWLSSEEKQRIMPQNKMIYSGLFSVMNAPV